MKYKSVFKKTTAFLIGMQAMTSQWALAQMEQPPGDLVRQFTSPNGVIESCIRQPAFPGGHRSKKDYEKEMELCNVNFYDSKFALCPKTWSTSAGTMVYNLADTNHTQSGFESQTCSLGKNVPVKKFAKFKQTMNAANTSGTFAPSSAIYYFFSRYLNTSVTVPVAVMRTMDKDAHYSRVAGRPKKPQSAMNAAAWTLLAKAEQNPAAYSPTRELFTEDRRQIYGVLANDKGERYGIEINGIRSKWGAPQNEDFKNTMPFLALRSTRPLLDAMADGRSKADSKVRAATGNPSDMQMFVWMNELSEIVLMDYVMSQQDRVGNIDYVWKWITVDDQGEFATVNADSDLPRTKMDQIKKPAELNGRPAVLVQRTWIGDNDAGGRVPYANWTKTTKMVESLRHMNPKTYKRFIELAKDFAHEGPLFQHLKGNFFLDSQQLKMISNNTQLAANILKSNCQANLIRFDLDKDKAFQHASLEMSGYEAPVQQVGCE